MPKAFETWMAPHGFFLRNEDLPSNEQITIGLSGISYIYRGFLGEFFQ